MRAGTLRRRVAILRQGLPVDDGLTTKPAEYKPIGSRKAEIEVGRGRPVTQQVGQDHEYPVTFKFRRDSFTSSITDDDRLLFGGRTYHLDSAISPDHESVVCVGVARRD